MELYRLCVETFICCCEVLTYDLKVFPGKTQGRYLPFLEEHMARKSGQLHGRNSIHSVCKNSIFFFKQVHVIYCSIKHRLCRKLILEKRNPSPPRYEKRYA
jgi:hypothetical protein